MTTYIIRRILVMFLVLIGVSIIVFLMVHLVPGDPARIMLGVRANSESVVKLREQMGLNEPLIKQYLDFASNAIRGDLGRSVATNRAVIGEILTRLDATLLLAFTGMGIAIIFGIFAGVTSAVYRDTWIDSVIMILAMLGVSVPSFWLGLMLIVLFAVNLNWFPSMGYGSISNLVLPAISLGFLASTVIARMTRASMLEVLYKDYIYTARAKGLSERTVVYKHALRNALISVITIIGVQFGSLLGGTVIIEKLFAWPGIGRLAINAIMSRDFPLIQGIVLFIAFGFSIINLIIDIIYTVLDPRIKYS
ncbi:MAG: nickel ABC transporter permease [Halanaerobiales bacterium]